MGNIPMVSSNYMKICCALNKMPKLLRLICGIVFLLIGLPIFLLPIPLGLVLLGIGSVLTVSSAPKLQNRLIPMKEKSPKLYNILKPFLVKCNACSTQS